MIRSCERRLSRRAFYSRPRTHQAFRRAGWTCVEPCGHTEFGPPLNPLSVGFNHRCGRCHSLRLAASKPTTSNENFCNRCKIRRRGAQWLDVALQSLHVTGGPFAITARMLQTLRRRSAKRWRVASPAVWYPWQDLNLHAVRRGFLIPGRLPFRHRGVQNHLPIAIVLRLLLLPCRCLRLASIPLPADGTSPGKLQIRQA